MLVLQFRIQVWRRLRGCMRRVPIASAGEGCVAAIAVTYH